MDVDPGNLRRRLVHVAGAVAPLSYVAGLVTWRELGYLFVAGSVVALVLEAGRLSGLLDLRIYEELTREYEQKGFAGYALYTFSMTLAVLLFPPAAAVPATLVLAIADPISGLLSSGEFRTVKAPRALAAMFGICTLIAVLFVDPVPALLAGVAATLADGVKPVLRGYVIDDNLTIPPAVALAISLGWWLVGGPSPG